MKIVPMLTVLSILALVFFSGGPATAASAPPAPTPLAPANGASVVVPFTISWSAVTDPTGIIAYNWQVSPSPTFSPVIMQDSTSGQTQATVSGLANGTYFWRVQAVNGAFLQGAWSQARSFKVTGVGPGEPGTPTLNPPKGGTQFHPWEYITFTWSAVPGATSYVFEASTDPSFPVATKVHINNIPDTTYTLAFADEGNWLARVYAVNADGLGGVPSNTTGFSVFFSNPLPPPPSPLSPVGGATVNLPVTLSWTDVPNPQPGGYEVQISSASDFKTIEQDLTPITPPQFSVTSLTAGTKFWRVRSFQGNSSPTTAAVTAWSKVATFTVNPAPPTVTSVTLPSASPFSGDVEFGQVQLSAAAPAGGSTVTLTSTDANAAPVPASVTVPAGVALAQFQFQVGQVTAVTPVTVTATLGSSSASFALTVQPPSLKNLSLPSSITGGTTVGGIVMLNGVAPPGGAVASLSSSSLAVSPPATVTIAAGDASVTALIPTSAVTTNTVVAVTATWNGGTVQSQIALTPQQPPASLTLSPTSTTGSSGSFGTVTLASPAPNDVQLSLASSNPAVARVNNFVTVPAGSTTGGFIINTIEVTAQTAVTISVSGAGVTKSAVLTVVPSTSSSPGLLSLSLSPTSVTGGGTSQGTIQLTAAASTASVVTLSSSHPAAVVPANVTVAAGASSATFTVTTGAVSASTAATISAAFGGTTKTATLTISPPAQPASDTVAVKVAEYVVSNHVLKVEATSTSASAVLTVYDAATGSQIGTLTTNGGGKYTGTFSLPTGPQRITVKSSLGGSATVSVTLK